MSFEEPEPAETEPSSIESAGEKCVHGVPFSDFCDDCAQEAAKEQPAWETVRRLRAASHFEKDNEAVPTGELKRGEEVFRIERVGEEDEAVLAEAYALLGQAFLPEELDPLEVTQEALAKENGQKYRILALRNAEGEMINLNAGGILDLADEDGPTGRTVLAGYYGVTAGPYRKKGLAREMCAAAIQDAAIVSQRQGKKLGFFAGETTPSAEKPWNKVGLKRVYIRHGEGAEKNYEELRYLSPPVDFDRQTGQPAQDRPPVAEHFMVRSFDHLPPSKEDMKMIFKSFVEYSQLSPEDFDSPAAYQVHLDYLERMNAELESQLDGGEELIFLTGRDREKARGLGVTITEHEAADQGHSGREDF